MEMDSESGKRMKIRPGKLDCLFHISHFLNCVLEGGYYSLFTTGKRYIHQANLRLFHHYK